ncbi:class F sortase [Pseudonocardia sp. KRD291]|uniref:class F sortase n=1 Tax=Pseudonocardia sp. KRD291 TaxID=2792007 RepID=UPI001C49DE6F|nr:class F sortase [Pseudonocardia sp. KRD291]
MSVRADAIGVDEPELLGLGVADDGSAEVPQDYDRVGRFDNGATQDRSGATVLLGHVDSRSGPAVFYRLRDLRAGDVIEVGLSDGTSARYAVARTEQVAKDRFPTFAVFGASADDVLRLVTCAGEFDRGARSYTDNLVVHAARV